MKNKQLTYVLLPAVLIIWLVVGHRFYNALKGDEHQVNQTVRPTVVSEEEAIDIYQLQLNYADPFLKQEPQQPPRSVLNATLAHSLPVSSPSPSASTRKPINWNALAYLGMIKNNETTHRVGIITVNGVRRLVKKNDRVAPFVIEDIRKDSIRVRSGQATKYILRQGRIKWLPDH